jgi:hypothetical protein
MSGSEIPVQQMDTNTSAEMVVDAINAPEVEQEEIKLTVHDIRNKIMGLYFGILVGIKKANKNKSVAESYITDELMLLMDHLIENQGDFKISLFVLPLHIWANGKIPHYPNNDKLNEYSKKIMQDPNFISDPMIPASKYYTQYITESRRFEATGNDPIARGLMLSIFDNWYHYTVANCMVTNIDTRCISSCIMINSILRKLLSNDFKSVDDAVPDVLYELFTFNKVKEQDDIAEISKYSCLSYITDIKVGKPPFKSESLDKYCMRSMNIGLWALNALTHGKTMEEIFNQIIEDNGDIYTNCAITGALLGACLGFDDLPLVYLNEIDNLDTYKQKIYTYFEKIMLIEDDTSHCVATE